MTANNLLSFKSITSLKMALSMKAFYEGWDSVFPFGKTFSALSTAGVLSSIPFPNPT